MDYPDQNSLSETLRVLTRGFLPAAVVGALLAAGVYYLADRLPDRYASTASLLVVNTGDGPAGFGTSYVAAPRIDAAAYRAAILSGPVLNDAIERLGTSNPTAADREAAADALDISVTEMDDSSVLEIAATGPTVDRAASLADAVAEAAVAWDQRRGARSVESVLRSLSDQIAAADETIAGLTEAGAPQAAIDAVLAQRNQVVAQLATAQALRANAVGRLEVLDPATIPTEPVSDRAALLAAAAFLLGAFVVYTVLIVRSATDPRVRSIAAFAAETGVPVIADVERPRSHVHRIDAEAANYLRAHVLHAMTDRTSVVIAVTSAYADSLRSKVATGLAESCARSGLATLLIDADLRTPSVGDTYDFRGRRVRDLEAYLADDDASFEPAEVLTGSHTALHVVPSSGSLHPAGELIDRSLGSRLDEWRTRYDVIVVDTPAVLEVADALSIAPHADGLVFVADLQRLLRHDARRAVTPFRLIDAPILGATVANADDAPKRTRERSSTPPTTSTAKVRAAPDTSSARS